MATAPVGTRRRRWRLLAVVLLGAIVLAGCDRLVGDMQSSADLTINDDLAGNFGISRNPDGTINSVSGFGYVRGYWGGEQALVAVRLSYPTSRANPITLAPFPSLVTNCTFTVTTSIQPVGTNGARGTSTGNCRFNQSSGSATFDWTLYDND